MAGDVLRPKAFQQRILTVLPNADHERARRRLVPANIKARSWAEARREIRALRRVYAVGDHWEVISTAGDFRHYVVLVKVGDAFDLRCEAPECRAPKGACWACIRVAKSDSMRQAMARIVEQERGAAPQTRPAPVTG